MAKKAMAKPISLISRSAGSRAVVLMRRAAAITVSPASASTKVRLESALSTVRLVPMAPIRTRLAPVDSSVFRRGKDNAATPDSVGRGQRLDFGKAVFGAVWGGRGFKDGLELIPNGPVRVNALGYGNAVRVEMEQAGAVPDLHQLRNAALLTPVTTLCGRFRLGGCRLRMRPCIRFWLRLRKGTAAPYCGGHECYQQKAGEAHS